MLAWDPVLVGLVVGSYQGCSEALHERPVDRLAGGARMGGAATATATAKWRQMGVRSVHEALGISTHDVRAPPLG